MTEILNIVTTASIAVLGACIGSFVNASSLRWANNISFVCGRSYCPFCKGVIKWFDLVPVVSWLILAGRCRACKVRISPRYVLAELISAFIFALCYIKFGFTWMTIVSILIASVLLAISLVDLNTTEIPNTLTAALIPLTLATIWLQPDIYLTSRIIGFFAISLPMLLLALAIKGAFGGGDIKLMAVCGFLLGWQSIILAFFVATILGSAWAIYLLAKGMRKRNEHMVFGPALATGTFISMLFGREIVGWYLGLLAPTVF